MDDNQRPNETDTQTVVIALNTKWYDFCLYCLDWNQKLPLGRQVAFSSQANTAVGRPDGSVTAQVPDLAWHNAQILRGCAMSIRDAPCLGCSIDFCRICMALHNFQNCLHGKYLEISTENDGTCTGKLGLLGQRGQWDRCRKHVQVVWFQRGKLSIIGCFATTITLQYIHMFAANPTFARIGSRISFDMLKSLCRASVFLNFPKPRTLRP